MKSTSLFKEEKGSTVIIFLFIMSMLAALAVGALQVTSLNLESSTAQRTGKNAFYAAEVGIDLAANAIIGSFENLAVYSSSAENGGDADGFIAVNNYRGHNVKYKITNPQTRYLYETVQGNSILTHYAYTYEIEAESTSLTDNTRETLREKIRILETPLVQWFVFYGGPGGNDSDLEITPGPGMTSWGRIHSNGDIWLRAGCSGQLRFQNFDPNNGNPISTPHSITAAGEIKNIHKGQNAVACTAPEIKTTNTSLIWEDNAPINFVMDNDAQEAAFNDFVFVNEPIIQAPGASQFQRLGFYEQRAADPQRPDVDGIQIIGQGGPGAGTNIVVSRPVVNTNVTALIAAGETSPGVPYVGPMPIIRDGVNLINNCREGNFPGGPGTNPGIPIQTTDIDLYALELWYTQYLADPANGSGTLADAGFLVYASRSPGAPIPFPNTGNPKQAIRLMQIGAGSSPQLSANTTFATDNPVYIDGDFNSVNTVGAAIIGDAINLLSISWNDSKTCPGGYPTPGANGSTQATVRAAFFGGYSATDAPGGTYGGGLHNYMRYHERWSGRTADFKGAMIGLWTSVQETGNWCQGPRCYQPPTRAYGWDSRFGDPDFWPPFMPSIFGVERVGFLE
jgi:hypothetical protein